MPIRAGASLMGGFGSGNLGTLFLRLTADSRNLVNGMNQAETAVLGGSSRMLASVGRLAAGIATAFVGAAAGAVKAAADFEESFTGVRKTVDATEAEFAQLETAFRGMAKEMPSGVNEINKVAEAAGALGVKTENLLGFTKTMIQMGEVSNLSADQAAVALAHIANSTQMAQENFDRLGATIVGLGLDSAASETEITEMATRIALAGHQVGLTQAQIVAFAATIASVGIEAEAGGSAISQAMIKMAQAVSKGDEKLALFAQTAGLSIEEFSNLFRTNAAEAVLKFVNGLDKIKKSGGDVFGTLDQLALDGIRVTGVISGLSGAGNMLNKSLADADRLWAENRALIEAAEKRYKTFWSQLKITWNVFKDILITVGQEFLPVLKDLNEKLREFLKGVDPKQLVAGLISIAKAAAIAAAAFAAFRIGGLIISFGQLLQTIGTLTISMTGLATATASARAAALAGVASFTVAAAALASLALVIATVTTGWQAYTAAQEEAAAVDALEESTNRLSVSLAKQVKELREMGKIGKEESDRVINALGKATASGDVDLQRRANQAARDAIKEKTDAETQFVATARLGGEAINDAAFNIDTMTKKFAEAEKAAAKMADAVAGPQKMSSIKAKEDIDRMFAQTFGEGAVPGEAHVMAGLPGADPATEQMRQMQADRQNMEGKLSFLKEVSAQEVELLKITEDKKVELIKSYNDQVRLLMLAQAQLVFSSASNMFGDLAGISESFGGKQSAAYKSMFAASKAFAIANATVQIATGIANAAAASPWYLAIPAIASVVAATAGIVSSIQSVQMEFGGGKAAGGAVMPGKTFLVGERGPELFSPSSAGNITPNDRLGGRVNVVVNNFSDAQAEVRQTDNGDERTVEIIIARTKNSIASDIRQGTGDVTKSMASSFGLKRAGR